MKSNYLAILLVFITSVCFAGGPEPVVNVNANQIADGSVTASKLDSSDDYTVNSMTLTEKVQAAWADIRGDIYASGSLEIVGDADIGGDLTGVNASFTGAVEAGGTKLATVDGSLSDEVEYWATDSYAMSSILVENGRSMWYSNNPAAGESFWNNVGAATGKFVPVDYTTTSGNVVSALRSFTYTGGEILGVNASYTLDLNLSGVSTLKFKSYVGNPSTTRQIRVKVDGTTVLTVSNETGEYLATVDVSSYAGINTVVLETATTLETTFQGYIWGLRLYE
jgi:hypothetical protein